MIDSGVLVDRLRDYEAACRLSGGRPTCKGLADRLGVGKTTINNVLSGFYRTGRPYTNKPHISRIIDNTDFEIIRDFFKR